MYKLPNQSGAKTFRIRHESGTISSSVNLVQEPVLVNMENEMTVAKFRISSYAAQITSIVSGFRKYYSKVLKRFIFFRNRGKFENRHFSCLTLPKMAENCAFSFARTDQRDYIYQYTLGSS